MSHTTNNSRSTEETSSTDASSSSEDSDDTESEKSNIEPRYLHRIDRYTVHGRIGKGYFSTVWIAHDNAKNRNHQYVALKICKSNWSFLESAEDERRILSKIRNKHADCKHLMLNLHTFTMRYRQKKHIGIVFSVMRMDLLHLIENNRNAFSLDASIRLTKQILLGLHELHEKCGVVHTDLKPENILIEWCKHSQGSFEKLRRRAEDSKKQFDAYTKRIEEKHHPHQQQQHQHTNRTSRTSTRRVKRLIRCRGDRVLLKNTARFKAERKKWTHCGVESCIQLKIADFGSAEIMENGTCKVNEDCTITTRPYRAPEIIKNGKVYNEKVDIWAAGCILFEIATGRPMFDGNCLPEDTVEKNDRHLQIIYNMFKTTKHDEQMCMYKFYRKKLECSDFYMRPCYSINTIDDHEEYICKCILDPEFKRFNSVLTNAMRVNEFQRLSSKCLISLIEKQQATPAVAAEAIAKGCIDEHRPVTHRHAHKDEEDELRMLLHPPSHFSFLGGENNRVAIRCIHPHATPGILKTVPNVLATQTVV